MANNKFKANIQCYRSFESYYCINSVAVQRTVSNLSYVIKRKINYFIFICYSDRVSSTNLTIPNDVAIVLIPEPKHYIEDEAEDKTYDDASTLFSQSYTEGA